MKLKNGKRLACAGLCSVLTALCAFGKPEEQSIDVPNGSFENGAYGAKAGNVDIAIPVDWVWEHIGGRFPKALPDVIGPGAAPDGNYYASLYKMEDASDARIANTNALDANPWTAEVTVRANTLYTLKSYGRRQDAAVVQRIEILTANNATGVYSAVKNVTVTATTFTDHTVTLDTATAPGQVGKYLKVGLRARKDIPGDRWAYFDHVRMTAKADIRRGMVFSVR